MTKLGCSVTTCIHNADLCCCRDGIQVEGKDAKDSESTCCGSFDEKRGDSFQNSSSASHMPNTRLEVACEAVNCAYNEGKMCHAENIGIAGNGATIAKQTECATFKMR